MHSRLRRRHRQPPRHQPSRRPRHSSGRRARRPTSARSAIIAITTVTIITAATGPITSPIPTGRTAPTITGGLTTIGRIHMLCRRRSPLASGSARSGDAVRRAAIVAGIPAWTFRTVSHVHVVRSETTAGASRRPFCQAATQPSPSSSASRTLSSTASGFPSAIASSAPAASG